MAARAQRVDDVAAGVALRRQPGRRWKDSAHSFILTAPGPDGHTHCAKFTAMTGRGVTTAAGDGHTHLVRQLEILEAGGHTHELSSTRCTRAHDENGRHVEEGR